MYICIYEEVSAMGNVYTRLWDIYEDIYEAIGNVYTRRCQLWDTVTNRNPDNPGFGLSPSLVLCGVQTGEEAAWDRKCPRDCHQLSRRT
jgi:hypothetical protein